MKNAKTTNANKRLEPGTRVVSKTDGETGTIARVCTYRRNGIDAWSYLVDTKDGREIWEAGELFLPEQTNSGKTLQSIADDNQGLTYSQPAATANAARWEATEPNALVTPHRRGRGWIIQIDTIK